jgi:hypothetical protein
MKRLKKIKPYTRCWEQLANEVARTFAPEINPCANCGYPVVDGYCCNRCGTDDPKTDHGGLVTAGEKGWRQ